MWSLRQEREGARLDPALPAWGEALCGALQACSQLFKERVLFVSLLAFRKM